MTDEHMPFYGNEVGDAWITVEDAPDQHAAGQWIADQTGLVHTFEGREHTKVQECECVPTTDHCVDDPSGAPCLVQENVDCWHFLGWDDPSATLGGRDHVDDLFTDLIGSLDDEPPVLV